ncbi:hypothetical protein E2C01_025241 [Portunus trituberculatus]|uniref:Uncharacterized protein n=1 Tax=Portunus trituberculatus TaxID=210409 RepID=A0A5B7ECQ5_PORTR|nr:hypothetical protein [Portunus trituberculatus]
MSPSAPPGVYTQKTPTQPSPAPHQKLFPLSSPRSKHIHQSISRASDLVVMSLDERGSARHAPLRTVTPSCWILHVHSLTYDLRLLFSLLHALPFVYTREKTNKKTRPRTLYTFSDSDALVALSVQRFLMFH